MRAIPVLVSVYQFEPESTRLNGAALQRWDQDGKSGAAVAGVAAAANVNFPAVSLDDLRRDPKPQPRSGLPFGGNKGFKDSGQYVLRNAHP